MPRAPPTRWCSHRLATCFHRPTASTRHQGSASPMPFGEGSPQAWLPSPSRAGLHADSGSHAGSCPRSINLRNTNTCLPYSVPASFEGARLGTSPDKWRTARQGQHRRWAGQCRRRLVAVQAERARTELPLLQRLDLDDLGGGHRLRQRPQDRELEPPPAIRVTLQQLDEALVPAVPRARVLPPPTQQTLFPVGRADVLVAGLGVDDQVDAG